MFEIEDIVSSLLSLEKTREDKQRLLERYNVRIQALKGINGTISKQEVEKLAAKLLTK